MATSIRHLNPYRETLSLPAGPPLDRMHSEDAPVCLGSALTSSKPGYFPGCPGFFYVSKRGSRSLPHHHQQKANEPDNDEQDIACRIYSGSIHKRLLSVSPPRREASSQAIVSQRSASRPPRQPSHGSDATRARNGQALRQMGICVRICTQTPPTPSLTWAYSDTGCTLASNACTSALNRFHHPI